MAAAISSSEALSTIPAVRMIKPPFPQPVHENAVTLELLSTQYVASGACTLLVRFFPIPATRARRGPSTNPPWSRTHVSIRRAYAPGEFAQPETNPTRQQKNNERSFTPRLLQAQCQPYYQRKSAGERAQKSG